MRIGLMLGGSDGSLAGAAAQARRAQQAGFASFWLPNIFGIDAITAAALVGREVERIELGTAVVPTYPRHPAALAQQALTAAAACGGGRLVLGIGVSHKIVIEDMYGYDFGQPIRHMREYLAVLLPLLERHQASFTGTTVRANIGLTVPGEGRVPVMLAALGTQMLRLAGQQTDGTILWMTGPATVRDHVVPVITGAAAAAGRPAPRVVCTLPVCVTSDPDAERKRADRLFAIYGQLPSYRAMLDREGAAGPGDVAIVGDEDAVGAQISALAEAGVTDFVAGEYGNAEDAARTRAFVRSLPS